VLEPVVFDPKLKYVGQVTPPVEWLGLQRQRIPILAYEALITNLESVVTMLERFYLDQNSL
jgi:hypothetical protein